ncbi:hypothetical protein CKA32_000038 [Geitlerinema sp. FC II]|nr:hypothetical protein CKA32_000038 [Geitlerinema sp. FC II]
MMTFEWVDDDLSSLEELRKCEPFYLSRNSSFGCISMDVKK